MAFVFFFFSSRRRHTRSLRDWSSDVCSSDLPAFQDVLDFGYLTGWRRGEVFTLEWRDVDRQAGVIRLRPEMCKTREGRVLVLSQPLRQLIERRWHARA